MPISTANGQLALMELDQDWEPGLPLSPGSLDQADQQQLLWGFPEVLWGSSGSGAVTLGGVFRRQGAGRVFRGTAQGCGVQSVSILQTTLPKYVEEEILYLFDFSNFPEVKAGETLSAPDVPAVSGVGVGTAAVTTAVQDRIVAGKAVQVEVTGGTAGQTYELACTVTTSGGSKRTIKGRIAVE